jgi:hypothetical protein
MKKLIIAMFALVLFYSCSTLPEPDRKTTSLLVGQITWSGSGYTNPDELPLNGDHYFPIELTFLCTSDNKPYIIKSDPNGFIFSTDLPSGTYMLQKVSYTYSIGSKTAEYYATFSKSRSFTITTYTVRNLGKLDVVINHSNGVHFFGSKGYDEVKASFKNSYPSSKWLELNWENENL